MKSEFLFMIYKFSANFDSKTGLHRNAQCDAIRSEPFLAVMSSRISWYPAMKTTFETKYKKDICSD